MWTVYKHTAPGGKIYIGITHQKPELRWRNGEGYKSNNHFYNAIQKYGWDNIDHEIVRVVDTQDQAEKIERELILHYKSYDRGHGYNKALGGHVLSEESRRKIGRTRKERGIKPPMLGKHLSDETKRKIGEASRGRRFTHSEEARRKISRAKTGELNPNYGKGMPEKQKQLLISINERPVIQIVDGKEVWYRSSKAAMDATGIFNGNITRVCKGTRATAGGYVWKYAPVQKIVREGRGTAWFVFLRMTKD